MMIYLALFYIEYLKIECITIDNLSVKLLVNVTHNCL
jgi:hypothetical protein